MSTAMKPNTARSLFLSLSFDLDVQGAGVADEASGPVAPGIVSSSANDPGDAGLHQVKKEDTHSLIVESVVLPGTAAALIGKPAGLIVVNTRVQTASEPEALAASAPTIAWKDSAVAEHDGGTEEPKPAVQRQAWLQDFVGAQDRHQGDLAHTTGLKVVLKPKSN